MPIDDGIKLLEDKKYTYTLELAQDLKDKGETELSFYRQGDFINMCRGPHAKKTGQIDPTSFKLNKIAGAYWKGSEKNTMLQRIYGVAMPNKKELKKHLAMLEEAKKRDHRVLAPELGLYMISEEVGKGLPLWLPNGAFIRKKLEDYMYELERKNGYSYVYTPVLTHKNLYETSGHLSHYHEDMYNPITIEDEEYYLKPMNCPHHHMIYRNKPLSYRDLPLRLSDFGLIHRYERSGVLTGFIRARCFSQNDAHIYCVKNDLKKELLDALKLFDQVYRDFDITDYWFRLSLPDFDNDEKFGDLGNKSMWDEASAISKEALEEFGAKYVISHGDAAFYGPKIDVQTRNVSGNEDTIATMQVDFYSPDKFDLVFTNEKGEKEQPVIIHRAIMGSFDRFLAFLTEKTAGNFPTWLCPTQIQLISVSDSHVEHSKKLKKEFEENDLRVNLDSSNETVSNKIRKAVAKKIPYLLVIGDKEVESSNLNIRKRGSRNSEEMDKEIFISSVLKEVEDKK